MGIWVQAWWRGFALRQLVPVLLLHAHRVCGIVERHRKRLVQQVLPQAAGDSVQQLLPQPAVHSVLIALPQGQEALPSAPCVHDSGGGHGGGGRSGQAEKTDAKKPPNTHSTGHWADGVSDVAALEACRQQGYTTAHAQEGLKRKLALSWSAKRITYPLTQDLSSCVAYLSANIDVTVCLCFVSNLISFHLAERIGSVRCEDCNPTAQTTLALKRLHSIVQHDQKVLVTRVQQRFRGWRVRHSIFGVLPLAHARNT